MKLFKNKPVSHISEKDDICKDILTLFTVNKTDSLETMDNAVYGIDVMIRELQKLSLDIIKMRTEKNYEDNYRQ